MRLAWCGYKKGLVLEKAEAKRAALQLWRELPAQNRSDVQHAVEFARLIARQLPFETLGDHDKIVAAWLIRDIQPSGVAPLSSPLGERHDGQKKAASTERPLR